MVNLHLWPLLLGNRGGKELTGQETTKWKHTMSKTLRHKSKMRTFAVSQSLRLQKVAEAVQKCVAKNVQEHRPHWNIQLTSAPNAKMAMERTAVFCHFDDFWPTVSWSSKCRTGRKCSVNVSPVQLIVLSWAIRSNQGNYWGGNFSVCSKVSSAHVDFDSCKSSKRRSFQPHRSLSITSFRQELEI